MEKNGKKAEKKNWKVNNFKLNFNIQHIQNQISFYFILNIAETKLIFSMLGSVPRLRTPFS